MAIYKHVQKLVERFSLWRKFFDSQIATCLIKDQTFPEITKYIYVRYQCMSIFEMPKLVPSFLLPSFKIFSSLIGVNILSKNPFDQMRCDCKDGISLQMKIVGI